MKLSVLDQSPIGQNQSAASALRETVTLARELDGTGYERYWLAEHHASASFAGTAPEILALEVLNATSQMRVGTGGVMLPLYSPQKVAEVFNVIAALHPGRVDLGVGRAGDGGDYVRQLVVLHTELGLDAHDVRADGLKTWILGAGHSSAPLAAAFGAGYVHAAFLHPDSGVGAIRAYREALDPLSVERARGPILAVRVIVADDEDRARMLSDSIALWRSQKDLGLDRPFSSPEDAARHHWSVAESERRKFNDRKLVHGTALTVRRQLEDLADKHGVDEIMVSSPIADYAERLKSFQLLAEEMSRDLAPTTGVPA